MRGIAGLAWLALCAAPRAAEPADPAAVDFAHRVLVWPGGPYDLRGGVREALSRYQQTSANFERLARGCIEADCLQANTRW